MKNTLFCPDLLIYSSFTYSIKNRKIKPQAINRASLWRHPGLRKALRETKGADMKVGTGLRPPRRGFPWRRTLSSQLLQGRMCSSLRDSEADLVGRVRARNVTCHNKTLPNKRSRG